MQKCVAEKLNMLPPYNLMPQTINVRCFFQVIIQTYYIEISSFYKTCFLKVTGHCGRFPCYHELLLLLLSHFSRVRLCATPQTATRQAPLSLGFSRQEYWSGLPFPPPMHESEKWKWSRSVMSDSSRPHGLQPTRLLHPWDFPGKSTGVGCHCLLQLPWALPFFCLLGTLQYGLDKSPTDWPSGSLLHSETILQWTPL